MTDKIDADSSLMQLRTGKISRREFVGQMLVAGLSFGAASSLMSGSAVAAAPKRGGRLVVGTEGAMSTDSLDPIKFQSSTIFFAAFSIYDLLVNRTTDLEPEPWLALSWASNADATEWTFQLRKDVTFHDGKEFTADDVIYSYARHLGEKSESPSKSFMSQIVEMRKEGRHAVRFKLTGPNADFPMTLTDSRLLITQSGYEDFTVSSPGTGPFKVKDFKPGYRYVFERNDDYWGSDGPWVDELELIGINDTYSRINALMSGDINVLLQLDNKAVGLLESKKSINVIRAKSGRSLNIAMMGDRSPTNNNDLRLAMKYAVDREQIVANVLKGYGHIGNDHPISPIYSLHCDDIPQRPYDPDRAFFHWKKAGMEGQKLDFYTSNMAGTGSTVAAQVFQQSAAVAGIQLNIIQPPADTYWSSIWRQKPMCSSGWDMRPTVDVMLTSAFKTGSDYNETAWGNERFDRLLLEARGTSDFDRRKEMYCELQRMVQDEGGHITMAYMDVIDAARVEVKGITPNSSGPLGFYQMARTAWIDE